MNFIEQLKIILHDLNTDSNFINDDNNKIIMKQEVINFLFMNTINCRKNNVYYSYIDYDPYKKVYSFTSEIKYDTTAII